MAVDVSMITKNERISEDHTSDGDGTVFIVLRLRWNETHIRERRVGHRDISLTAFFLLTPPSHLLIVRSPLRPKYNERPHPPSKDLGT